MKIAYYCQGESYIAVTSEYPVGFKGVLFVGKTGPLDSPQETVFTPQHLRSMAKVPKHQVPDEWIIAFGYEEPDPVVTQGEQDAITAAAMGVDPWSYLFATDQQTSPREDRPHSPLWDFDLIHSWWFVVFIVAFGLISYWIC